MLRLLPVFSILSVLAATVAFGQDLKSDDPKTLIVNGGFEDQKVSPWELKSEGGKVAVIELDGSEHAGGAQSARVEFLPGASGAVVVEQTLNLKELQTTSGPFRVVASCKVKNAPEGKNDYLFGVSFTVSYEDGTKKWESGFPGSFFDRSSTEWQTLDFLWTPEKPVTSAKLRVVIPPEAGVAWIDEIAIVPINE